MPAGPVAPHPQRAAGPGDLEVVDLDAVRNRQGEVGGEQVGQLARGDALHQRIGVGEVWEAGRELLDAGDPSEDAAVEGQVGERGHGVVTFG